jgi:ElaB/YqjD/DUF883 family membrane-anchored ribosome-binding protein
VYRVKKAPDTEIRDLIPNHEIQSMTMNIKTMNEQTRVIGNDLGTLADDASTLLAATADVAGDKVTEARKRLAAALESGKKLLGRVREKAVGGAKATDQLVRENPYQTIAIVLSVGAVIGYMLARGRSRNGDRERYGTGPD